MINEKKKDYNKKWHAEHKLEANARRKEWYQQHKDYSLEQVKQRAQQPEIKKHKKEYMGQWYAKKREDPEFIKQQKEYKRQWYQNHKEERKAKAKLDYQIPEKRESHKKAVQKYKSTDKWNVTNTEWRTENHDELRTNNRNWERENTLSIMKDGKRMKIRVKKRPFNDKCELCDKEIIFRPDWHHWDKQHPELGVWVCQACHDGVESYEHGCNLYVVIPKYIELKTKLMENRI